MTTREKPARHAAPDAHDLHDDGVMEDLVEWVEIIVKDAVDEVERMSDGGTPADVFAETVAFKAKGSFEDLLVNHYGED